MSNPNHDAIDCSGSAKQVGYTVAIAILTILEHVFMWLGHHVWVIFVALFFGCISSCGV